MWEPVLDAALLIWLYYGLRAVEDGLCLGMEYLSFSSAGAETVKDFLCPEQWIQGCQWSPPKILVAPIVVRSFLGDGDTEVQRSGLKPGDQKLW